MLFETMYSVELLLLNVAAIKIKIPVVMVELLSGNL